ncbi:MAG: hypothetical protein KBD53_08740 [Candidatus Omnitrophica bacterium]|nr:hypothetical protein [Candidatus Omnitrophota bacterium]
MSKMTVLAGTVSGLRLDQSVTVSTTVSETNQTTSQSIVRSILNFRINNQPVFMKVTPNITNGDSVTAAGFQRGEFEVIAVHNHTTKTIYSFPKPGLVGPILGLIFGLMFRDLPYYIGWMSIVSGAYYTYKALCKRALIKEAWSKVEKAVSTNSSTGK